jgi:transposase
MLKYSVGIDVSAKTFNACFSSIDTLQKVSVKSSRKFSNDKTGFNDLHTWIQKLDKEKVIPLVITMEATGVYYEACALFLYKKNYSVSVVLPNKAKKYLQATGLKSKNDKFDAQGLGRMGAEQALQTWTPMNEYFYQLRSLTRQHQSLQELKTNVGNQVHADKNGMYQNKLIVKQHNKLIDTISNQIEAIEKTIEDHIATNEEVNHKVKNICKIKGVGVLTVAIVLAETNGFTLFENSSQLVSYAGFDVVENQSGNHIGRTRISKKGNARLRRAMHMPSFNLVRYNQQPFLALFERTLQRHQIKMKSYVAVQKKLLILIYSLWKKNQPYDPEYLTKITKEKELVPTSVSGFEEAKTKSSGELSHHYAR